METVKVPADAAATSGPWTATIVSEQTFADGQRQGTNIGAVSTGTWTCRGDSMTVTATLGSGLPSAVLSLCSHPGVSVPVVLTGRRMLQPSSASSSSAA